MIIRDRYEVYLEIRVRMQERVPDGGPAVIFRPAQNADVDEVPIAGQPPMPLDPRVRTENDVRLITFGQVLEEMGRSRRLPEKLVRAPRAAMTEEKAVTAQGQPELVRQLA